MSSALAMVLTVAMAVPGNGPEMVSGDMEEGLDLSGEWKGLWWDVQGQPNEARLAGGRLLLFLGPVGVRDTDCTTTDEGLGRFRINLNGTNYHGIYRQEGSLITFCFRRQGEGRPSSFRVGDGYPVFILHRVKSRK